jgi:uncharacterized repeat protein (TIGR02543 family)
LRREVRLLFLGLRLAAFVPGIRSPVRERLSGGALSFYFSKNKGARMKKVYAGIVLAGMMAAVLFVTGCPNPTGEDDPVYSIILDETGPYAFPGAAAGYGAQTAKTVTVSNTGNQATGALAIERSGADSARFRVSKNSLGSIAAGGTDTFTVAPNTGLADRTAPYTATITVSGENGISASFTVSFTVSPRAEYSISLSETGTYHFPAATVGYEAQAAETVTVTNTGNQATGSLTIGKSGTNADSFTVSKTTIADIAAEGTDTFTVAPATGLADRTAPYTATITVSGENNISASFLVSFKVNPTTPVYSIGLSQTEPYEFTGADAGYGAQTPLTVTVLNTGNRVTGALTVGRSGANPGSFTVDPAGLSSIELDETGSFTVAPALGLRAGAHSATITVSGSGGISESFAVSFTVYPAYSIGLSETGTHTFPGIAVGYGPQTARTVTVTNTGDDATGALTVGKSGTNIDSFAVSKTSLASLAVGGTDTFTVVPNTALGAGPHAATITVSGGNGISASFNVSFTVAGPTYSVDLSETETYTFPAAFAGYGAEAQTQRVRGIAVTNTGNQATGALTIGKSGADSGSFTVSETGIADIGVAGTGGFTVVPNTGLAARAAPYTATITVSGANITSSKSFTVSFTVNAPGATPSYEIELGVPAVYPFRSAVEGYGAQRARTVTVRNTGNRATDALSIGISGADSGRFTVSKTGIADIGVSASDSFTVVPNTGIADRIAPYVATITVSGANITSKSFEVSFTVDTPSYGVSLSETDYVFPDVFVGYGTQRARTVTATNTGNLPTGTLNITKSGTGAASFTVSKNNIADIGASARDTFTVAPLSGLGKGTYTATIMVSGGNSISASFDVSFTVNPYTVTFNAPGSIPATSIAQTIANNTVILPKDPSRNGYTFAGWYTAENGGNKFTATTVVRADATVYARWLDANANLAALSVSPGALTPAFASYSTEYSATVPNAVASINVSATPAFGKALIKQYPSDNSVKLNVGLNIITVKVTAEDGTTSTDYTIAVTREQPLSGNTNLASLGVSVGMLSPAFSANVTGYTVTVPTATSAITVTATAADTWKAVATQSPGTLGNPVTLESDSTTIAITVTAENGNTKSYSITVNKGEPGGDNTVNVSIGIADKIIYLDRDTGNDLSRELNNALRLTAPDGYQNYIWLVDGSLFANNTQEIELNGGGYNLGTHSVLLAFEDGDGITYGCEVLFRVAR